MPKKAGYYSPEAIIQRAKDKASARQAQNQQVEQVAQAPVVKPPSELPPVVSATSGVVPKVNENLPAPKPFMAIGVNDFGMPVYGPGFKGLVRKWWADISDPQKLLQDQYDLSSVEQEQIQSEYETNVQKIGQVIEQKTNWSQWGEKFFGLTSEEIAAMPAGGIAEKEIAEKTDKSQVGTSIARAGAIFKDTAQNVLWGGLAILNLDDQAMRKITATQVGVDALADRYNKDDENFAQKLTATVLPLRIAGGAISGLQFAKDTFTIGTKLLSGELKWNDAKETIGKYRAASEMAYTMVWDDMARKEFEKGIAEGKDPYMLSQNLGNVGYELAGSVFNSPSTYLGLNVKAPTNIFTKAGRLAGDPIQFLGREIKWVGDARLPWKTIARIPNAMELFGYVKNGDEINRFTKISIPELENALKDADTVKGEFEAIKLLDKAAKTYADRLDDMHKFKKWWNLASLDSNGKVSVTSRDSSLFIQKLVNKNGLDGALQITRDLVLARSGGRPAIEAARRLLSSKNSGLLLSDVGNMTGEILSRLKEERIVDLLEHADDPAVLHDALFRKLESVVHEFVPSVDEMVKAKQTVLEAAANGVESAEKIKAFAKMYDEMPPVSKKLVTAVNALTRLPEAITRAQTKAMGFTFMNLMPRAWTRNITGQAWAVAAQLGLRNAIEISFSALLGLNRKASMDVLEEGAQIIKKRVGYVPAQAMMGIGEMVGIKKAFGMFPSIQRSEQITRNGIMVTAINDTIEKSLPAVVKNLPEWDNLVGSLPKEQQPLMFLALKNSYGDWNDAVDLFRKWAGKGEIEAWRVNEPPVAMRKQLEQLGLMDMFREAQMNAKNSDDFDAFIKNAIKTYEKSVEDEFFKQEWVSDSMPEKLTEFGMDLANHASDDQGRIIRGLIQQWQNTFKHLDEARTAVINKALDMANEITAQSGDQTVFQNVQAISAKLKNLAGVPSKNYDEINYMREAVVRTIRKTDKMTMAEMVAAFKEPIKVGGKEVFNLSKIYPNVDFSTMNPAKFKKLAWSAMLENVASKFRDTNIATYEKSLGAMDEMAKLFGSTIDDMAGSPAGDSVFRRLAESRKSAMLIEEAHSWQRFFRQLDFDPDVDKKALLKDVVGKYESIFPDWKGGKSHIVSAVNRDAGNIGGKNVLERIQEKAKIIKSANAAGEASSLVTKDSDAIADYLSSVTDEMTAIQREFGKATRAARGTGETPKLAYNKLSQVVSSLPNDAMSVDYQTVANKAESLGFAVPPELKQFFDSMGGEATRREVLNFSARLEMGMDTGVKVKIPYEEITVQQALIAIGKRTIPPPETGQLPSQTEAMYRGMKNFTEDIRKWGDSVIGEWGKTVKSVPVDVSDKLIAAGKAVESRMDVVRQTAAVTAVSMSNFILHDYQKTYLDHALTYLTGSSFHYWTTRTYMRAIETLLENPKYATMYIRYKQYMAQQHADMPEWYRQNIQIGGLLGIDENNPYFVNLEASVNPIYGLTGTDFNDPRKRVDWVSRTVDDMGKLGPTFSPLISWSVAAHLYDIGEEDAAQRFMGRLLPQTAVIKSASARFLGKAVETDPFVNFLDGGVEPYERNRVVAAMAMMVRNGEITSEQMIEASRDKSGEIWELAVTRSADARFQSDATSFFLGAALRPRTQDDMNIEKFWKDYGVLISSRSMMTADQYRQAWDEMRDNPDYGMFVDALLLSRKSGGEQDTAYAYNVLGRVPPGGLTDAATAVGIDPQMLQAFYDNKGDFDEMGLTKQDQMRFMAGIADMGAILAIPPNATREDWTDARIRYSQMNEVVKQTFGEDIMDGIAEYYDAGDKDTFLEMNPLVKDALDFQTLYINQDPKLMEYYGGIQKLEQYYRNATEKILLDEFGQQVADMADEYNDPRTSDERQKELKPFLKAYFDRKKSIDAQNDRAINTLAEKLPESPVPLARPGVSPQGVSQNALYDLTQDAKSPQEWEQIVGPALMSLIQDYQGGADLPYSAKKKLDRIAEQEGYFNGEEMMRMIIMSLP